MSGPSNAELFQFLGEQLSFSVFRRAPDTLISFKETIEFIYVPEGTADGPAEGLLYEGTAPMTYEQWCEFVAGFALLAVDSRREGDGEPMRVFRGREIEGTASLSPSRGNAAGISTGGSPADQEIREEMHAERGRYVWSGRRAAGAPGIVDVHLRRIACRGADSGQPARLLFLEKLRLFQKMHGGSAATRSV